MADFTCFTKIFEFTNVTFCPMIFLVHKTYSPIISSIWVHSYLFHFLSKDCKKNHKISFDLVSVCPKIFEFTNVTFCPMIFLVHKTYSPIISSIWVHSYLFHCFSKDCNSVSKNIWVRKCPILSNDILSSQSSIIVCKCHIFSNNILVHHPFTHPAGAFGAYECGQVWRDQCGGWHWRRRRWELFPYMRKTDS